MQNVQNKPAEALGEKVLTVTVARKEFASLVTQVKYQGMTYCIERHGEPMAAVVPMAVLQQWNEQREALFKALELSQGQRPEQNFDEEEVMVDVLEAQQQNRIVKKPTT